MHNKVIKYYGKKIVIDNVEFNLEKGVTLILGENGSGKTTLLKILAGLIKKYEGYVECGDDVSLLLDSQTLYNFKSGQENIYLFLDKSEQKIASKYISALNMNGYINKMVNSYSNGMKKKLALVIALSKNKKYLLLDEPTNSLDIDSVYLLKKILLDLKEKRVIVIVSHDISIFDIHLIDTIYKIKDSKLVSLSTSDLNYKYYKIKTLNAIFESKYEYESKDGFYYFKILDGQLADFSREISKYLIVEMNQANYLDDIYMRGLYND